VLFRSRQDLETLSIYTQPVLKAAKQWAQGQGRDPSNDIRAVLAVADKYVARIDDVDRRRRGVLFLGSVRFWLRGAGMSIPPPDTDILIGGDA